MDTMADLLVVVVYCLGVYTLLGVVAGLFEWGEYRLRRTQRGLNHYRVFANRRANADGEKVSDQASNLSRV